MTIRHLSIYKIVCEEMSITKAAKRLYMTQPAVSHVITQLEREAGTPLFERRSQKIYINQRGMALLQKAVRLLEVYEEFNQELAGLEKHSVLRIGSSITIAAFWLPSAVAEFERNNAETPLEVNVDSAFHTVSHLERGEIDIALVEGAFYLERFEKIPFSSYGIVPLCSPAYLKTNRKHEGEIITMEELSSLRLLLREKGSAVRDVLEGAFLQKELEVRPYWTSVNSLALLKAAKAGLGIAVLPDILAEQELLEGSLVCPVIDGMELTNHNYIAYHKSNYLTSAMNSFIEIVTGEVNKSFTSCSKSINKFSKQRT